MSHGHARITRLILWSILLVLLAAGAACAWPRTHEAYSP